MNTEAAVDHLLNAYTLKSMKTSNSLKFPFVPRYQEIYVTVSQSTLSSQQINMYLNGRTQGITS